MPKKSARRFTSRFRDRASAAPEALHADEVRDLLRYVPPTRDRTEWARITSAVIATVGEAEGVALLQEWDPEDRPGAYREVARHPLRKVTTGTLVHLAKQGGWTRRNAVGQLPPARRPAPAPKPAPPPKVSRPLPPLSSPTPSELAALVRLRGLGPSWAGLEIMHRMGLLFTAEWDEDAKHIPCFILTDSDRKTALRRRMDGRHWARYDEPAKTWHPEEGGKGKTWAHREGGKGPVGLPLLRDLRKDAGTVFILEGSPDAWALFSLAWDFYGNAADMRAFSVVVMPDAGTKFTPEQAALLTGRHAVIVAQDDLNAKPDAGCDKGDEAAQKWAAQLHAAGVRVSIFRLRSEEADFLPPLKKDLCDAAAHAFAARPQDDDGTEPHPLPLSAALFSQVSTALRIA